MATWTAGTALASGALISQAWVQNVVNAQKFLAANDATYGRDLFFARQGAGQAITVTTGNVLTFGGEDIDVANGHSTTTNTSRYTVQAAGKYRLTGGVAIPSSAAQQTVRAAFYKNGSALSEAAKCYIAISNVGFPQTIVMPTIYASLAAGDYVEIHVVPYAAGFTTEVTNSQSFFGVEWCGA